jgi:hypothetical protein
MSPPEVWGPPIWTFFHTLAEHINEESFMNIKFSLFSTIKRICNFLPCPDCSHHAIRFLAKVNINKINNKLEFKNMLYVFHNTVNKRKKKRFFNYTYLEKYRLLNVGSTFNHFVSVYHTKGNMNLIAESFQRNLLLGDLKKWLINNYKHFKPTKPRIQEISINNDTNNDTTDNNNNNNIVSNNTNNVDNE